MVLFAVQIGATLSFLPERVEELLSAGEFVILQVTKPPKGVGFPNENILVRAVNLMHVYNSIAMVEHRMKANSPMTFGCYGSFRRHTDLDHSFSNGFPQLIGSVLVEAKGVLADENDVRHSHLLILACAQCGMSKLHGSVS
jgi:hypothetical protein